MEDPKAQEVLEKVERAIDVATGIIDNTRELATFESMKKKIFLTNVSIKECLDVVQFIFESKLKDKNISLNISFPENDDEFVLAETQSLTNSVLSNIISNAIKFSHQDSSIDVIVNHSGDFVEVKISDQGVGMPEEFRKQLFDADNPRSTQGTFNESGIGFGMPIMKNYMDLYGGSVFVKS